MTAQQTEGQATFQNSMEKIFDSFASLQDSLQKVRAKAWDHYSEIGLPTHKSEAFRYIKLRHLLAPNYVLPEKREGTILHAQDILNECRGSCLVFVNGHFAPELSHTEALPAKMVILPLKDALKTYGMFLQNQWAKALKEETDTFAALNAALHPFGVFIYLPPNCELKVSLQIHHVVDVKDDQNALIMPRLHLAASPHAKIDLISTTRIVKGVSYGINQVFDFSLDEGACVTLCQVAAQNQPLGWHLEAVRSRLKKQSSFKSFWISEGSLTSRTDYKISLEGENSEAFLHGIWSLTDKKEAHAHILMEHQAPNCRSNQHFKGILRDTSRSSFEGKILVRQLAQKTEAFQRNQNLLLSDHARADSKPNLEIFADDVKASHGATFGQLNEDELFYLRTKGLSKEVAQSLLLEGFCRELVDALPSEELKQSILKYLRIREC